jgi:ElaB/YqjD/DUF883 family membrane-anchored ribosome-binding protein
MSTHSGTHGSSHEELVTEANGLLDRLSNSKLGEEAKILAGKLHHAVDALKEKTAEAKAQVKVGVDKTEVAIKENPWTAVGIAFGVGILIGVLVPRGRD